MPSNKFIKCPACGALVLDINGPVHRYMGAIAGCWNIYGKVLNREFGVYNYPEIHRLTVDAYSVQHPGKESGLTVQSVAVHLLGLYFSIEKNITGKCVDEMIKEALKNKNDFYWLTPPQHPGRFTVADVYKSKGLNEHEEVVKVWAKDVWNNWSGYHDVVAGWAEVL
jgi:hypothetical protein